MDIQNSAYLSIHQAADRYLTTKNNEKATDHLPGNSFREILEEKKGTRELKFSKHAVGRLQDRGITLSDEQLGRLEDGAEKAREKGIQDSLVIVDAMAFIVNIPNNTVVTAMDSNQTEGHFFTNINGAVIM